MHVAALIVGGVERAGRHWVFASRVGGARETGDAAALAVRQIGKALARDPPDTAESR